MTAQRVLVTGAGGFLGSALAAALLARGHQVVALDVGWALGRLPDHPALERHTGDVRDEALMRRLVTGCHRVLHMAAVAGVHDYMSRPFEVLDVNVLGTRAVLLAAREVGAPVLFASSSEAYGKNPLPLGPQASSWLGPTTNARWCYAASKITGEHFAWALVKQGLTAASVRYFNAYGPRLDEPGRGRVISQFIGAVQEGRPLRLVDGGDAVRCFCYIDDCVESTLRLLFLLGEDPRVNGRPFNIGRVEPVTMATLAHAVVRLTGHPHGVEVIPGDTFFGAGFEEIPHRIPEVDDTEAITGYAAAISLEEGLRRTLDWWGLLRHDAPPPPPEPIPNVRPSYALDERLVGAWIRSALDGRTTNHGPHVQALEAEAAAWLGLPRALAMGSCADALNIALRVVTPGPVVLPAFTYVSTLNAVELAGREPNLCDVDPHTWTMCPDALAALLAARPDVAVVMPVNVFGVPPDLDRLVPLAHAAGAKVVYDAAQGVGTTVHGQRYQRGPDLTAWSFHATKALPAIEGGLLYAADPELYARCLRLRTHGLPPDPIEHEPGYNAKLDELSAATARHSLARIHVALAHRRAHHGALSEALATSAFYGLQAVPAGVVTNAQNLGARVAAPVPAVIDAFRVEGIEVRRYFDPPLHHLRRLRGRFDLPVTEALWGSLISLPLHTEMSPAAVRRITEVIRALPGAFGSR